MNGYRVTRKFTAGYECSKHIRGSPYVITDGGGCAMTEAFLLADGWHLIVDGIVVQATWNSKGAAEAGIPVERGRRERMTARSN
jgi:hypothetical protein